ncbi:MAG: hypothetical protein RR636_06165 [Clostridium sp.]|uniref:hypothetical protein n=1 Tax=Clostridium sp. TaxID=1506 RepID=UPI0030454FE6
MKNKQPLFIINLLSFIFLLMSSFIFAKSGSMFNTNEVMALFMPAPYAFRIWILIYALLGTWVIKEFFANAIEEDMYESVGYWFAACMVLTGLTILVPIKLSPIFIIGALITALIIYKIISESGLSKYFNVPFSFLTAWLSVATIANISLVLKIMGVTKIFGIGEVGWAIILIIVGSVIAILFSVINQDNIFPLVFIWGYVAIAVEQKEMKVIGIVAVVMSTILLITIIYNVYRKYNFTRVIKKK